MIQVIWKMLVDKISVKNYMYMNMVLLTFTHL